MIVLAFVVAGVFLLLSGLAVVIAIGLIRRATVQVADADARRNRALELLEEEQAARAADRALFEARINGVYVSYRETVRMYRRTLEDVARWVTGPDEDDPTPAPTPAAKKRVM